MQNGSILTPPPLGERRAKVGKHRALVVACVLVIGFGALGGVLAPIGGLGVRQLTTCALGIAMLVGLIGVWRGSAAALWLLLGAAAIKLAVDSQIPIPPGLQIAGFVRVIGVVLEVALLALLVLAVRSRAIRPGAAAG